MASLAGKSAAMASVVFRPLPVMQTTVVSSGEMRPCSNQLGGDASGNAARGFRKDAFGFRQQLDGVDDLRIGDVLRPAAGFANQAQRKGTVGGVANRQTNARWYWAFAAQSAADCASRRRQSASSRWPARQKTSPAWARPSRGAPVRRRPWQFCRSASRRPWAQRRCREVPSQAARRFRSHASWNLPRSTGRRLTLTSPHLKRSAICVHKPVDVVVVAVDADDARPIDRGVQNFRRFEIGRNEHAGVETLLRALRRNGIGEIAGGRTADGFEPKASRRGQGRGHHAVLEGERGKHTASFLK